MGKKSNKTTNKTVDDTEMFNKKNSIDLIFKEYLNE